jgi:hypothetical protein
MSPVTLAASWVLPIDGPPLRDTRVFCSGSARLRRVEIE